MDLKCNYEFCDFKCNNKRIYDKHIHRHNIDNKLLNELIENLNNDDSKNKINIYCLSFSVLNLVLEKISKNININIINLKNVNIENVQFYESDILIVWEMFNEYYIDKIIYLNDKIKKKIWVFYEHPTHYENYFKWKIYFDYIFSMDLNELNRIKHKWIPAYHFLFEGEFNENNEYSFIIKNMYKKEKFMCTDGISSAVSQLREKLIQTLVNTGVDIDIYGINSALVRCCRKNHKGPLGLRKFKRGDYKTKSLLKTEVFKKYKFVVVCENIFTFGNFTEKIIDCLGSLSIPIIFGSFNAKYIFPDLFDNCLIDGFEFKNCNELVNYIENMSNDEYNKRINNIKKVRNKYYKMFSCDYICDYISNEITKIINNDYTYENEFKNINDKFKEDIDLFESNKKCNFDLNLKYICNRCKSLFDIRYPFLKHIRSCK
jgi:hypothetical protein